MPTDTSAQGHDPMLVERLLDRQRDGWRRGERVLVEALVEGHPDVGEDRKVLLELICSEMDLRAYHGETPQLDEYLRRFPALGDDLRKQFEVFAAWGPAEPTVAQQPTTRDGSPVPPPTEVPPPEIEGYEILELLGQGGMGVVYKAWQPAAKRFVALKMILGGFPDDKARARFSTEAHAVARLQHSNVVTVFEVGEHRGLPFFSLEFCAGGSLEARLKATQPPAAEAARLVETLARAVHHAHERDIVHRDLKPANVLLTDDGTLKVADFGLAKRLDEAARTHTEVAGTAPYMAPEQALGMSKEIGPVTDVYALGAILYECLTGRPPFKAANLYDTLKQVVNDEPVPPRRLQSKTPRDLETVCLKCLEKQAARRYATALELAEDLRRFQANEPVSPRPTGPARRVLRRTARAVRRHPGVVLAVLASVALGLLAGFLWPRLPVPPIPTQPATPDLTSLPAREPDPLPPDLALVPADAVGFVSVREADLMEAPQFAEFRRRIAKADPQADQLIDAGLTAVPSLLGLEPTEVDRATLVFLETPRNDSAYQSYLMIVSTKESYDPARRLLLPDAFKALPAFALHPLNDHLLLVGPSEAALQEFSKRTATPQPQGGLADALRAAAQPQFHVVIGLNPPAEYLRAFGEKLPPKIREDVLPVTEARAANIALTLAPLSPDAGDRLELQIDARLTFADAARAKSGSGAVSAGLALLQAHLTQLKERLANHEIKPEELARQLGGASPLGFASLQFLDPAVYALVKAKTEQQGDTVRVLLGVRTDAPVLDVNGFRFDAQAWVKDAENRTARVRKLEAIGRALKQYDEAHGRLPPAELRSPDGRPLLSWRVLLLPYLGQEKLFDQFKLNEPWDGPNNQPLLDKMPSVYAAAAETPGTAATPYQVLAAKGTPFEEGLDLSLKNLAGRKKACILVVEAGEAVPWTKPMDLSVSPEGPPPRLGGEPGFAALFADGSARFFRAPINDGVLRALLRRDGDEKIDVDQLP